MYRTEARSTDLYVPAFSKKSDLWAAAKGSARVGEPFPISTSPAAAFGGEAGLRRPGLVESKFLAMARTCMTR
jgi:hypothetical protein